MEISELDPQAYLLLHLAHLDHEHPMTLILKRLDVSRGESGGGHIHD